MKNVFVMVVLFFAVALLAGETVSFAKIEPSPTSKDKDLCKLFKTKAADYKANMRDDAYAKATLASYEERVLLYCEK
jgi:hypothetical protein